jgi:broad specificity phosphatase PhoE
VFVRHGQAGKQGEGRERGASLSALGKRQATRVGKRLQNQQFDHIYSSDMRRANQTFDAIRRHHEETPCTVTAELREITHYHFSSIRPEGDAARIVADERIGLDRFVSRLRHQHKSGENILIVCHGNLMRTMIPLLADRDPKQGVLIDFANASVTVVEMWPSGDAVIRLANCVAHLLARQVTT